MTLLSGGLSGELAFTVAVAASGGLLMGFTGFGSTLVMVPLLAFAWGPTEAVAIATLISIIGSTPLYPDAVRTAKWPEIWPAVAGSLIAIPVGTTLLLSLDPAATRRLMGAVVVITALIMLRGWRYQGPRGRLASAGFGVLGGFTNGFFGIGAPAVTMYYLSAAVPAAVQRANILIVLLGFTAATIVALIVGGAVSVSTLARSALLMIPFAAAAWVGGALFRLAPDAVYRTVALWLLTAMGVAVVML